MFLIRFGCVKYLGMLFVYLLVNNATAAPKHYIKYNTKNNTNLIILGDVHESTVKEKYDPSLVDNLLTYVEKQKEAGKNTTMIVEQKTGTGDKALESLKSLLEWNNAPFIHELLRTGHKRNLHLPKNDSKGLIKGADYRPWFLQISIPEETVTTIRESFEIYKMSWPEVVAKERMFPALVNCITHNVKNSHKALAETFDVSAEDFLNVIDSLIEESSQLRVHFPTLADSLISRFNAEKQKTLDLFQAQGRFAEADLKTPVSKIFFDQLKKASDPFQFSDDWYEFFLEHQRDICNLGFIMEILKALKDDNDEVILVVGWSHAIEVQRILSEEPWAEFFGPPVMEFSCSPYQSFELAKLSMISWNNMGKDIRDWPAISSEKLLNLFGQCSYCAKPGKLNKCSRCKQSAYCDKTCQSAHWPTHKIGCK